MTISQHKNVVDQRQPLPTEGDRYAEASKRLRGQLRDDKVYEECNAWALKLCKQAEQYNWPSRPRSTKTGDIGELAAKLADRLESESWLGQDALAKRLWGLVEQHSNEWRVCGPLVMQFTDNNQIKMPPKATALALALAYGFRKIPDCVKNNKPFEPQGFDRITGGHPCLPAAVDFANAALKAINEQTNVAAVKQWLKNNRGRFRYWGFGSKTIGGDSAVGALVVDATGTGTTA
jgi:hypothetical protein